MFVVRLFGFPLGLQSDYHTFDALSGIGSGALESFHTPWVMPRGEHLVRLVWFLSLGVGSIPIFQ